MMHDQKLAGVASRRAWRGRQCRRANDERLLELSRHLPGEEGELFRSVVESGLSARALARLTGAAERTMQRRIRNLRRRVASPLFEFVVRRRSTWPRLRREVGESVVLRGRSMRATSRLLGVSLHQVRREFERIRAAADARNEVAHQLRQRTTTSDA